jgi:N-methylhydantoinase B
MDVMGGGGGARTFADGIDSGGIFHSVSSSLQNVETSESRLPILQLYRKERMDTAGPGRFRGGVGIEAAVLPHKGAGPLTAVIMASGVSQPEGHGLAGGGPGCVKVNAILRQSNIRELLAGGVVPVSGDEIASTTVEYRQAKDQTELGEADVIVYVIPGGGGYGDPLRRDVRAVEKDLREGLVSLDIARSIYGVVGDERGVDEAATGAFRDSQRRERLRHGRPPGPALPPETVDGGRLLHPVSDTVEMIELDGRRLQRCTVCHTRLAEDGGDYLAGTLVCELPLSAISPINRSGREDLFVLRQYVCAGCGTALALHVQLREEPHLGESVFAADFKRPADMPAPSSFTAN